MYGHFLFATTRFIFRCYSAFDFTMLKTKKRYKSECKRVRSGTNILREEQLFIIVRVPCRRRLIQQLLSDIRA